MADPSYVRLANRLSQGIVADVLGGTTWSIAGLDVRKFPEDPRAAVFVRRQLNEGKLEPASKAEWEEVHDDPVEAEIKEQMKSLVQIDGRYVGWQEARIQRAMQEGNLRLEESRRARAEEEGEDYEEEEPTVRVRKSKEERLQEQRELGLDTGDPEEQLSYTRGEKPRKSTKKKKSSEKVNFEN